MHVFSDLIDSNTRLYDETFSDSGAGATNFVFLPRGLLQLILAGLFFSAAAFVLPLVLITFGNYKPFTNTFGLALTTGILFTGFGLADIAVAPFAIIALPILKLINFFSKRADLQRANLSSTATMLSHAPVIQREIHHVAKPNRAHKVAASHTSVPKSHFGTFAHHHQATPMPAITATRHMKVA